jgi:hypothetical protein
MAKKTFYNRKRYWYHVSTTLKDKYVKLIPWDECSGFNRGGNEPDGKRICVAPTIEQCITAIPYILSSTLTIYRTKSPLIANKPIRVFDSKVTQEGWFLKPTTFVKVGILKFSDVEKNLKIKNVISNAASGTDARQSGKVLKWWKQARVKRIVKKA